MGWKSGNFYRIKNKEEKKSKEQGNNIESRAGLLCGDWLTRQTVLLAKWSLYKDMPAELWFADMAPGQELFHRISPEQWFQAVMAIRKAGVLVRELQYLLPDILGRKKGRKEEKVSNNQS